MTFNCEVVLAEKPYDLPPCYYVIHALPKPADYSVLDRSVDHSHNAGIPAYATLCDP